jgi:hypothetical protein
MLLTGIFLAIAVVSISSAKEICACAIDNGVAYQPTIEEVQDAFRDAGSNQLGPSYFDLPQIEKGYPNSTLVSAAVPCVILKAIGRVESSWRQARNTSRGEVGPALVSPGCGYGIMQITSGMQNIGDLDEDVQRAIAEDYRYNIGWGAKMLVDKWNAGDYCSQTYCGAIMGNRDPEVAEDWYFAVWAYNWWYDGNNPNNPDYPWPRDPFDGTQSWTNYPYQELVWGYAANPPTEDGQLLWTAVDLTLPDRASLVNIGDTYPDPGWVDTPQPSHSDTCLVETSYNRHKYLPIVWK